VIEHREHVDEAHLWAAVERGLAAGWRFASLIADQPDAPRVRLDYVFVAPDRRTPVVVRVDEAVRPPSIARICPAASWAERETRDQYGVVFASSPDARALVHHEDWPADLAPLREGVELAVPVERVAGSYTYDHVEGEGVMEIRVGPIHAGIIEPGQFRFSTVGETVLGLEIRLGYVHRGVELAARGRTPAAALVLAERISGTSSVAHSVALARAMEHALGIEVPPAHAACRSLLVELERFYNHVGDIGNLCAGTALSAVGAHGMILKEELHAAAAHLTGSRYLRNLIGLGGVRRLPQRAEVTAAIDAASRIGVELEHLAARFFGSSTNLERLTGTGHLAIEHARALGTVGVVARASGIATDSRTELEFPSPIDRELYATFAAVTETTGDVAARARVRLAEARAALVLVQDIAKRLAGIAPQHAGVPTRTGGEGLGWCEGPRGEILTYVRVVDGRIARMRVRSPSRMNWPAIEHAMPGNIVPDFPLINKSFNLSYAGCDL
jgi:Ni,Fe-hydrogenase III large subunit/Ni,Fe-hydrogenase III component G